MHYCKKLFLLPVFLLLQTASFTVYAAISYNDCLAAFNSSSASESCHNVQLTLNDPYCVVKATCMVDPSEENTNAAISFDPSQVPCPNTIANMEGSLTLQDNSASSQCQGVKVDGEQNE